MPLATEQCVVKRFRVNQIRSQKLVTLERVFSVPVAGYYRYFSEATIRVFMWRIVSVELNK